MMLAKKIHSVLLKIEEAKKRAGRNDSVQLIAVTKQVPLLQIQEALDCGLTCFGENRIEEAVEKIPRLPSSISWHMIGHLQSRKVKQSLSLFDLIHSVDSLKLMETIQKRAIESQIPILLEVNVSKEPSKYGFSIPDLWEALNQMDRFPCLQVKGLMTMAPLNVDPEVSRPVFKTLKKLFDEIAEHSIPHVRMQELSMGMSQDFEVAIEEGATMVRIGSALFGSAQKA